MSLDLFLKYLKSQMFHSCHYIGSNAIAKFKKGEDWHKIFGPIFIYLNSASDGTSPSCLWENAKLQVCGDGYMT